MDREAYCRGIQVLKNKIKEMAAKQKEHKKVLRMPRKTVEDIANVKTAVNLLMPSTVAVSWLQSRAAIRKFKISAYLNIYASLRRKAPCHFSAEVPAYLPDYMREARKDFDKACATSVDSNSWPCRVGKSMLVK